MGSSPEATLAYGYDLGNADEFKAEQVGEYGYPALPWFNEDLEDDDEIADFGTAVEERLLTAAGFTETDWRADGYYDRKRAAEASIGVKLALSGSDDSTGWMLVATGSEESAEWTEALTLDLGQLAAAPAAYGWDAKLTAALTALGITPTQTGPKWLVFPYYG